MKTIEKIRINFENCEALDIPACYLIDCFMTEFDTSVRRTACNDISMETTARYVVLHIAKAFKDACEEKLTGRKNVFDRIKNRADIYSITLFYKKAEGNKETSETYLVDWDTEEVEPDDHDENPNQECFFDAAGGLVVCICFDKDFHDLARSQNSEISANELDILQEMQMAVYQPPHKIFCVLANPDFPEKGQVVVVTTNTNDIYVALFDGERFVELDTNKVIKDPIEWRPFI